MLPESVNCKGGTNFMKFPKFRSRGLEWDLGLKTFFLKYFFAFCIFSLIAIINLTFRETFRKFAMPIHMYDRYCTQRKYSE